MNKTPATPDALIELLHDYAGAAQASALAYECGGNYYEHDKEQIQIRDEIIKLFTTLHEAPAKKAEEIGELKKKLRGSIMKNSRSTHMTQKNLEEMDALQHSEHPTRKASGDTRELRELLADFAKAARDSVHAYEVGGNGQEHVREQGKIRETVAGLFKPAPKTIYKKIELSVAEKEI